jgi:NADH:ubiquinone oxidoreductase subunit 5 (subunit L)/multisubunit Na+/H+ antiporter MnhA subunit
VLALLSVIGGWLQFAGLWHPLSDFLEPAAEPLIEPSGTQDLVTSILDVGLGLAGMFVAWQLYGVRRARLPEARFWRAVLEHKFYFDEAYDLILYRPASATALFLTRFVERPLVLGGVEDVATATRTVAGRFRQVQTGLVRTYVLALASSVAVLLIVFVSVR